jgi:uncharacterized protein (DUF302 family)
MIQIKRAAALLGFAVLWGQASIAAEDVVSRRSAHPFATTVELVEQSARQKGFQVFARLDHAAAAASVGQTMPPSTVIVIGNPRVGTARFIRFPTLAIDLPLRILVWQDSVGTVSMTYNTAQHMLGLSQRHGLPGDESAKEQAVRTEALMSAITGVAAR